MAKKKKQTNIIFKITSILLLAFSLLLVGSIAYLNILNIFYLLLVTGVILLLDGVCLLLMNKSKKKKTGMLLSGIFILLFGLLSFYVNKTTGLLSDLNLDYKTYNYSVVVLKDSSDKKLKDISNKELGYYDDGSEESKKSLEKIQSKIEIEPDSYEDTHALANALLEQEVDAILIEDSYLEILSESIAKEEKSFKELIKKIYSFTIISKTSDISKDLNVTKEPFNIYVSGIDTYGEISSVSRSDVNMIVTVNPKTQQILLTSIPRDYYVQLHGKSGYKDKLTHAGLYGTDMSIQTLEDLLDIEINYYVKVNFSSVIDIVNAIDGVTVYSDYTFTSIDNYHYTKGYNEVNGEEALSFARERKAFAIGDRQRIKNQQALLKAIFDKCTSKAIITKYSKLLDSLSGSFVTNMKMSRLTALIKLQLTKNYTWNLVTNSLNGTDASNYTYSAPSQKAYVMEPIPESVEYGKELINKVLDGEILDKEEVDAGAAVVNKVTQGSTSNSSTKEDTTSTKEDTTTSNQEGLKAKLGRTSVEFVEGDEYVYYPYTATYNGKDVTNSSDLTEKFSINGKTFDDYQELVLYVSKLDSGEYTIIFTIQYQKESVILNQSVTIKESVFPDDSDNDSEGNEDLEDKDKQEDNQIDIEEDSKKED